ncbi:hypothetical protein BDW69DRAFT_181223 [Aspergillus filifer]
MYSYTPTSKFLVLAPIQSAPLSVATEQTEIDNTQVRERSDSKSSTTSSQLGRARSSTKESRFALDTISSSLGSMVEMF